MKWLYFLILISLGILEAKGESFQDFVSVGTFSTLFLIWIFYGISYSLSKGAIADYEKQINILFYTIIVMGFLAYGGLEVFSDHGATNHEQQCTHALGLMCKILVGGFLGIFVRKDFEERELAKLNKNSEKSV
jgi:hypothetical protein